MSRLTIDLTVQTTNALTHVVSAVPGAQILVYIRNDDGTAGSAASVFQNPNPADLTTLSQPLLADAQGRIPGWLDLGNYLLVVSGTGFTTYTVAYNSPPGVFDLPPTVELNTNKDQPSGYAGLDSGSKLKTAELPVSVVSVSSGSNKVPDVWAFPPSGDTTGATDSAAIQPLIDALSTGGGGNLLLQAGTYWGNLTLKPKVRVIGRGGWGGKTTWKCPTTYSGILLAGLNWATLTGKAQVAGDYLLGAPGCGIVGMTVDGNGHASNCAAIWADHFWLDDVIFQRATGDGLITEFTNIQNFADTAQKVDPAVGKLETSNNGGDGWVCRSQSTARWFTSYENGGWGLTVDSKDGSYSGGLFVNYLQVFLNPNGVRVGNINNPTSSTIGGYLHARDGEVDSATAGVGTGLKLDASTGASTVDFEMATWATAVDLNGNAHTIGLNPNRNVDVVKLNGCQKCHVTVRGGSGNTGKVINRVSEGGPNWLTGVVDIPAGGATLLSTAAYNFNSQTTIIFSANGAGGIFSTVKLPVSAISLSNGWTPSFPANNNQLEAEGYTSETYSASITTDASDGHQNRYITVTNATAFTINAPTNLRTGQILRYVIDNESGGAMGAITWNGIFRLAGAFTNPANTKMRTVTFLYVAGYLVELARAPADL